MQRWPGKGPHLWRITSARSGASLRRPELRPDTSKARTLVTECSTSITAFCRGGGTRTGRRVGRRAGMSRAHSVRRAGPAHQWRACKVPLAFRRQAWKPGAAPASPPCPVALLGQLVRRSGAQGHSPGLQPPPRSPARPLPSQSGPAGGRSRRQGRAAPHPACLGGGGGGVENQAGPQDAYADQGGSRMAMPGAAASPVKGGLTGQAGSSCHAAWLRAANALLADRLHLSGSSCPPGAAGPRPRQVGVHDMQRRPHP